MRMRDLCFLLLGVLVPVTAGASADVAGSGPRQERIAAGARLEVDLSDRVLYVLEGEDTLRSYPVAVGQPQHPTPEGEFRLTRVIWNPRWVPPEAGWARGKKPKEPGDPENPMGRAKIFFKHPDYYIHGTDDEASLGQAASHGCVRMSNDAVVDVAHIVMEHGGEPREPGWFQRVLNWFRSTEEVRLGRPVALTIRA